MSPVEILAFTFLAQESVTVWIDQEKYVDAFHKSRNAEQSTLSLYQV